MTAKLIGYAETGLTTAKFVRKRKSDGAWWNTSGTPAFQVYDVAQIANYGIAATETGATGTYTATDPAEGTEGDFLLVKAAGASLAVSDLVGGARWQGDLLEVASIKAKTDLLNFTGSGASAVVKADVRKFGGIDGSFSGGVPSVYDVLRRITSLPAGTVTFTSTTIEWGIGALGADNAMVGSQVLVTGGTGAIYQTRIVTAYNDTTGSMTIDRAWDVTPDNTSTISFFYDSCPKLDSSLGITLAASALDAILIESGISPSVSLVDDSGAQLTSINARQALALAVSALAGALAGAAGPTTTMHPAGKPAASNRISAAVDATGRTAITLRVPT